MINIALFSILLLGCIFQLPNSCEDDGNFEDNDVRRSYEYEFKEEYCKTNTAGRYSPWSWPELENSTKKQKESVCYNTAEEEFFDESAELVVKTVKNVSDYYLIPLLGKNGGQPERSSQKPVPVTALYCHVIDVDDGVEQIFFLVRRGYVLKPVKKYNKRDKQLFIYSKRVENIPSESRLILGIPTIEELAEQEKEALSNYETEFKQLYRECGNADGWKWPELSRYSHQQKEKLCIAGKRTIVRKNVKLYVSKAEAVKNFFGLVYCLNENTQEERIVEELVCVEPLYCELYTADGHNNGWFLLVRGGYVLYPRNPYEVDKLCIKKKISPHVDADIKNMLELRENKLITLRDQVDKMPRHCCIQ